MRNIKKISLTGLLTFITACSGGGGSSSPSIGGAIGSASIQIQKDSTSNYSCVGYTLTNSIQCADAGGSWVTDPTTLSNLGSCSKSGSAQNSGNLDFASCSQGTLNPICKVGSLSLGLVAAATEDARAVCSVFGGSVSVSCSISNSTDCGSVGGTWTGKAPYCAGAFPYIKLSQCDDYGGKVELALPALVGSSALEQGSSDVFIEMAPAWGSTALNDGASFPNLNPKALNAVIVIEQNGTMVWAGQSSMSVSSSLPIHPTNQTGTVRVSSPFKETVNGLDSLRLESLTSVSVQP